jgi:hypothetical protein
MGRTNGQDKSRKIWTSGESDNDEGDRKSQLLCFYCPKKWHMVSNCPSMKHSDPPVTPECTETAANTQDDTITAPRDSAEMTITIENYWVTDTSGKTVPLKESWSLHCASTYHICVYGGKCIQYTGVTKKNEREIGDFARGVAGKPIGQENVRLKFQLPGGHDRINEVVVGEVVHVVGAHISLSQSRLMERGL